MAGKLLGELLSHSGKLVTPILQGKAKAIQPPNNWVALLKGCEVNFQFHTWILVQFGNKSSSASEQ